MKKTSRTRSSRRAPKTPARTFLVRVRRELDAAPLHLNPAIARYIELAPQIHTLSLFDLQLLAADMEQAAHAGEQEANQVNELVRALEALAPEPTMLATAGF